MARNDVELLQAARRDPEAFRLFYERHVVWVFGWFSRRTSAIEDAMDLSAETFAQALASLSRFRAVKADEDGSARGWLHGIARNLLLVYLREGRTADRARRRLGIPRWDYAVEELERVEEALDAAALAPSVEAALDHLPRDQRETLELRVLEERSYTDIADHLGCAPVTARSRVFRALAYLRSHLQGEQPS
jgi:RNA polymerase sigma factor (sigma-70 family)